MGIYNSWHPPDHGVVARDFADAIVIPRRGAVSLRSMPFFCTALVPYRPCSGCRPETRHGRQFRRGACLRPASAVSSSTQGIVWKRSFCSPMPVSRASCVSRTQRNVWPRPYRRNAMGLTAGIALLALAALTTAGNGVDRPHFWRCGHCGVGCPARLEGALHRTHPERLHLRYLSELR